MVLEGFSERRGARPYSDDVSRVAIVLTDGRSQDNVTEPAEAARNLHVNMFAIGVTDHVLASELESIAGSASRWFYVDRFKDLDTRLRSLIQKAACPAPKRVAQPAGECDVAAQTGCDRALNERCVLEARDSKRGRAAHTMCKCESGFERHPRTHVCGGDLCNPALPTSCTSPEVCAKTLFGNHRCVCPEGWARDRRSGICGKPQGLSGDACNFAGLQSLPRSSHQPSSSKRAQTFRFRSTSVQAVARRTRNAPLRRRAADRSANARWASSKTRSQTRVRSLERAIRWLRSPAIRANARNVCCIRAAAFTRANASPSISAIRSPTFAVSRRASRVFCFVKKDRFSVRNECLTGENDCAATGAMCVDTDSCEFCCCKIVACKSVFAAYLCRCRVGFIDT